MATGYVQRGARSRGGPRPARGSAPEQPREHSPQPLGPAVLVEQPEGYRGGERREEQMHDTVADAPVLPDESWPAGGV